MHHLLGQGVFDFCLRPPPDPGFSKRARKIARYVGEFPPGPILAVAFSLTTLARIFEADWVGRAGEQLVVWDGNNRLSALAVRRAMGHADDPPIGLFVGS